MNEAATPSAQAMVARPRSGIPIEVRRGGALGVWLRICQRMRSFSSGGGVVSGAAGAPSSVASSSASRASHHVASSVAKREARGWMRSSATARPSFPSDRLELREARTRPALHRAERLVQARGDLLLRVAVEVREAEDGLLVLGQLFETSRDVVAQRGGFLTAVAGAGAVERLVRSRGKALLDGVAAPPAVERPAARDREEPRLHRRACRVEPARVAPHLDEGFLKHVFGIPRVLQDTNAEAEKDRCVPVVEKAERVPVARGDPREKLGVGRRAHDETAGSVLARPECVKHTGGYEVLPERGLTLPDGAGTVVPCRRESSPTRAASRRCRSMPRSRFPRRPGAGT